jgi:raffinose/stachyose/melibiose transport system substrate-binding protein
MKNPVKIISVIISAIMISFVFSSCFSDVEKPQNLQSAKDKSGNEKITLRFINSWGGNDSKSDSLQAVLDKFMKDNPYVVVKNESMFGDDFLPKIKTDFASGNNPDVLVYGPVQISEL